MAKILFKIRIYRDSAHRQNLINCCQSRVPSKKFIEPRPHLFKSSSTNKQRQKQKFLCGGGKTRYCQQDVLDQDHYFAMISNAFHVVSSAHQLKAYHCQLLSVVSVCISSSSRSVQCIIYTTSSHPAAAINTVHHSAAHDRDARLGKYIAQLENNGTASSQLISANFYKFPYRAAVKVPLKFLSPGRNPHQHINLIYVGSKKITLLLKICKKIVNNFLSYRANRQREKAKTASLAEIVQ